MELQKGVGMVLFESYLLIESDCAAGIVLRARPVCGIAHLQQNVRVGGVLPRNTPRLT